MQWRGWVMIMVLVGGLAAPAAWAAYGDPASNESATTSTDIRAQGELNIAGSITALKLTGTSKTVEVTGDDGKVLTIALDPSTQIQREGNNVKADQLQLGDQVGVSLAHRDGKDMAKKIEVTTPAQAGGTSASSQTGAETMRHDQMRTEAAVRDLHRNDLSSARGATDRVTRTSTTTVEEEQRLQPQPLNDLSGLRIIPNGSSRPGASITGPMAVDGRVRAALPLAEDDADREVNDSLDSLTTVRRTTTWQRVSRAIE